MWMLRINAASAWNLNCNFFFDGGGMRWPGHKAEYPYPSSSKCKNKWSCASSSPMCLHSVGRDSFPLTRCLYYQMLDYIQYFTCKIIHRHLVTGFPLVQYNQSVWSNRDWKSIGQTQIPLNSGHTDIHLTSCSVFSTGNVTARGSSHFCTSVVSNFIPSASFPFWNNDRCLAIWITHNCQ